MNALHFRVFLPITLFGFLTVSGGMRVLEQPFDGLLNRSGLFLGAGILFVAFILSHLVLKPAKAAIKATASLMRSTPPSGQLTGWLLPEFAELRQGMESLLAKHRQSLSATEAQVSQATERLLHAERLLREAFTALQGIFEESEDGLAMMDAHGSVVASNSRLDTFIGGPIETLCGRDAKNLLETIASRFTDAKTIEEWIRGIDDNPSFHGELEAAVSGAEDRIYKLRTAPMHTDTGEIVGRLWLVVDRSEVRSLRHQCQESQKLATIGLIAGGISHDFNNMLTTIKGNLSLALLQPLEGGTVSHDKIHNALQATEKASELVARLLKYSRQGDSFALRTPADLKRVASDVELILSHSMDPRITIRSRVCKDDCFVSCDVMQLEQVVFNLCLNACDALPEEGGIIEIGIDNVTRTIQGEDSAADEEGRFALISVRDNGHGIPDDIRAHIFDPFFTTKQPGKGTGLGLAIVQHLIREHKGWIELDSTPDQGTEFRILLPSIPASETGSGESPIQEPIAPVSISKPAKREGTILVVDDDTPVRSIAVSLLKVLGYSTVEATDGEHALDILARGQHVDVLMLDVYMPKLSGRDTFKAIRESGNDVPIVICSGFVIDPEEFTSMGNGNSPPVDIMLKPYSLDALSSAMEKAMSSRWPRDEQQSDEDSPPEEPAMVS